MAQDECRPCKLTNLPYELQDHILSYVLLDTTQDQLKILRQLSPHFAHFVDPHLFRTLHLSPSSLSFTRLEKVSQSARLAPYVRELVFHRTTWGGHPLTRNRHAKSQDDFEFVGRSKGMFSREMTSEQIEVCYHGFNEEVEGEAAFNVILDWPKTLRLSCLKLFNLAKLTTVDETAHNGLTSLYVRRRTGVNQITWTHEYFAPYEIINGTGAVKIEDLSMDAVNGEDFGFAFSTPSARLKTRFEDLVNLRLSFGESVSSLPHAPYDRFLTMIPALRYLSLDLTQFLKPAILQARTDEVFGLQFMRTLMLKQFPQLRSLDLTGVVMSECSFVNFIHRHRMTLDSLSLCDWWMPALSPRTCCGSILRALWKIGQLDTVLRHASLNGEFSSHHTGNGATAQDLPDTDPFRRGPIWNTEYKQLLQAYICHKHAYPWPIVSRFQSTSGPPANGYLIDELPARLGLTDGTWSWYRNIESDRTLNLSDLPRCNLAEWLISAVDTQITDQVFDCRQFTINEK